MEKGKGNIMERLWSLKVQFNPKGNRKVIVQGFDNIVADATNLSDDFINKIIKKHNEAIEKTIKDYDRVVSINVDYNSSFSEKDAKKLWNNLENGEK